MRPAAGLDLGAGLIDGGLGTPGTRVDVPRPVSDLIGATAASSPRAGGVGDVSRRVRSTGISYSAPAGVPTCGSICGGVPACAWGAAGLDATTSSTATSAERSLKALRHPVEYEEAEEAEQEDESRSRPRCLSQQQLVRPF